MMSLSRLHGFFSYHQLRHIVQNCKCRIDFNEASFSSSRPLDSILLVGDCHLCSEECSTCWT